MSSACSFEQGLSALTQSLHATLKGRGQLWYPSFFGAQCAGVCFVRPCGRGLFDSVCYVPLSRHWNDGASLQAGVQGTGSVPLVLFLRAHLRVVRCSCSLRSRGTPCEQRRSALI